MVRDSENGRRELRADADRFIRVVSIGWGSDMPAYGGDVELRMLWGGLRFVLQSTATELVA